MNKGIKIALIVGVVAVGGYFVFDAVSKSNKENLKRKNKSKSKQDAVDVAMSTEDRMDAAYNKRMGIS